MCQLSVSFSVGMKPVSGNTHLSKVIYTLCATLATSVVALGGLAAVQNQCSDAEPFIGGIDGFSGALSCKKVFRYYWFIIALEFVVATAALLAVSAGKLAQYRNALVGLFSVAMLLWIYQTNAFLGLTSIDALANNETIMRDRLRTILAGSIMTATLNGASILMLGYEAPEDEQKSESTVTVTQS